MKYLAAILSLVLTTSALADVKSEVVEMPSLCGPMRELESLILERGARWLLTGTSPAGKHYYYVNAPAGELYIIHPIEALHCLWLERLTRVNLNRDAAVGLLSD